MNSRLWLLPILLLPLLAQAAGPRSGPGFPPQPERDEGSAQGGEDNPLLKPRIPELPSLYGEEKTDRGKDKEQNKTGGLPPAPADRSVPLRKLARGDQGESRATPEMRAELQRQIAEFHALTGQPERSLATLLAAQNRGWLSLDGNRAALNAARLYHEMELPAEAERLYASLPDWLIPQDERQRFLLERVQSRYNRGAFRQADKLLARLGTPADPAIANRAQDLRIRLLMSQGRYGSINRIYEEQLGRPRNNLYTRYNLGVSLVAGGKTGEGIGQLDELGTIPAIDPEPLALRDQANLSLGWAFLQADQGATARPFFRRVRLNGPLANRALLALGWALLAPDGEPQEKTIARLENCIEDPAQILERTTAVLRRPAREPCGKPKVFRYHRDLEYEATSGDPAARLQAALAAWEPLATRLPYDPAVQEALLARGYVLEQLQEPAAATDAYRLAAERLETARRHLSKQREAALQQSLGMLDQLPAGQAPYLTDFVTSPQIEETRHALDALQRYAGRLQAVEARLQKLAQVNGESNPGVQQARQRLQQMQMRRRSLQASFEDVVRRLVEHEYNKREDQLNTYLTRARLALATLYEQGS